MIDLNRQAGEVSGFTYDQVAAPSAPAIGETWRQRDGSNLIVQDWFWNGAVWASTVLYSNAILNPPLNGNFNFVSLVNTNVFIENFSVVGNVSDGGTPHTSSTKNSYFLRQNTVDADGFLLPSTVATVDTAGFVVDELRANVVEVNQYFDLMTVMRFSTTRSFVGGPSGLENIALLISYRRVYRA